MRISHELLAKKEKKKKHRMYAAYPAVLDHTHTEERTGLDATYWNPVRMMSGSFSIDGTDSSINECDLIKLRVTSGSV